MPENRVRTGHPIDEIIGGLTAEIRSELRSQYGDEPVKMTEVAAMAESYALKHMIHEANQRGRLLQFLLFQGQGQWFEQETKYTDIFVEALPIERPYTEDPENFARLWGFVTEWVAGAIIGEIREDGV
jgi:hypothetical protein